MGQLLLESDMGQLLLNSDMGQLEVGKSESTIGIRRGPIIITRIIY